MGASLSKALGMLAVCMKRPRQLSLVQTHRQNVWKQGDAYSHVGTGRGGQDKSAISLPKHLGLR